MFQRKYNTYADDSVYCIPCPFLNDKTNFSNSIPYHFRLLILLLLVLGRNARFANSYTTVHNLDSSIIKAKYIRASATMSSKSLHSIRCHWQPLLWWCWITYHNVFTNCQTSQSFYVAWIRLWSCTWYCTTPVAFSLVPNKKGFLI